ncbi:hypothetical protein [Paenibacillus thalictri]|uniref:Flagellar protein FliT n=1 Tax=Paenibacillus thalictri TaxID=2527873 RepID=A0A4Q9DL29_9BACL|nr:hypothetical protein [Paenibacillus thalictri]TBL73018.1 hypothetical protein EYB31_27715 [Paenibacillus thalictri]
MLELIEKIEQLTQRLLDSLEIVEYEQYVLFIEQREVLITLMGEEFIHEETLASRIRNVVQADQVILKKMISLKEQAQQELNKITRNKTKQSMYDADSSYSSSVFFDRKY